MRAPGLSFDRIGILVCLGAGPDYGPGLAFAAADEMHEFLRRRDIAAKLTALLRHGAAIACRICRGAPLLQGRIDPQFGRAVASLNDRLAGFAGRGLIANIDVAITHDGYPFLRSGANAQARGKLRGVRLSRATHVWVHVRRSNH